MKLLYWVIALVTLIVACDTRDPDTTWAPEDWCADYWCPVMEPCEPNSIYVEQNCMDYCLSAKEQGENNALQC